MKNRERVSVFEVLGLKPNPDRTYIGKDGELHLTKNDLPDHIKVSLCNICQVIQDGERTIQIHDAAVLAAYFGLPEDDDLNDMWKNKSFGEIVAIILSIFSANGNTSFTKLL